MNFWYHTQSADKYHLLPRTKMVFEVRIPVSWLVYTLPVDDLDDKEQIFSRDCAE